MAAGISKQQRAYLYATVAVVSWSTIPTAFKLSLRHLGVLPLLFYASFVSTIFLLVYVLSTGKLALLKDFSRGDYLRSALLGFLNPFFYYAILLKAYSLLPAQQAQPLNFVWPITLVLLSIPVLKQKIKLRSILAVFISFIGVVVISTEGRVLALRFTSPTGVGLALGSTIIWSLFWIYNVRFGRDEACQLFVGFVFGTVFVLLAMLLFAQLEIPDPRGIAGAAYIGLFEMGLTFLCWLRALKLAKTTAHVVNLIYLVPFLSLVVVYFVLGEEILLATVVGLVFIIGGIILQKLWD